MRRRKFRRGDKKCIGGYILRKVIRKGFTEKAALEQRPEGSEEQTNKIKGKSFPGTGTSKCQGPEARGHLAR